MTKADYISNSTLEYYVAMVGCALATSPCSTGSVAALAKSSFLAKTPCFSFRENLDVINPTSVVVAICLVDKAVDKAFGPQAIDCSHTIWGGQVKILSRFTIHFLSPHVKISPQQTTADVRVRSGRDKEGGFMLVKHRFQDARRSPRWQEVGEDRKGTDF
jgi:hypothetical protein